MNEYSFIVFCFAMDVYEIYGMSGERERERELPTYKAPTPLIIILVAAKICRGTVLACVDDTLSDIAGFGELF